MVEFFIFLLGFVFSFLTCVWYVMKGSLFEIIAFGCFSIFFGFYLFRHIR